MKKLVVFAMALAMMMTFMSASVMADDGVILRFVVGNTTFSVNGVNDTLDAAPFNQDGRVMVPLRQIGEAIGADTIAFEDNTAIIDDIRLPIGVELAGGMGTPVIVDGRTFVPLGFIAGEIGATPRWDGAANAAYIYIGAEPTAAPAQQAPAAGGHTPAVAGENSPGIHVANVADGSSVSGGMIVVGNDRDVWPFSSGNEYGDRAFIPVPGETYRVSFNVTNDFNSGWRFRWAVGTDIFGTGANTPADYDAVNAYRVSPDQIATTVPTHWIEDIERQTTYTLVADVYFDGSEQADGLIGNIGLTGNAGESSFTVNWVHVEHNGVVIAHWYR